MPSLKKSSAKGLRKLYKLTNSENSHNLLYEQHESLICLIRLMAHHFICLLLIYFFSNTFFTDSSNSLEYRDDLV